MLRVLLVSAVLLLPALGWAFDPRPMPSEKPSSLAVGGGYLYGGIGGNLEFRYTPRLSLTAGIGVAGAFGGAHLYLEPSTAPVRYRLTAGVAAPLYAIGDGTYGYSSGPALGVGVTWSTARTRYRGISLDVATSGIAVGLQF